MEAGERWTLHDVVGDPIRAWDSREHQFRTTYDQLRPTRRVPPPRGKRARAAGRAHRLRRGAARSRAGEPARRVAQHFDQAGVITSDGYDFKGNLLRSGRQLAREYKDTLDWAGAVDLEPETFTSTTTYDALNRPISVTTPDLSVYRPTFNEAGCSKTVDVNAPGLRRTRLPSWRTSTTTPRASES